jgi:hypothetical protein
MERSPGNSPSPKSYLESLPDEMLSHIMDYLNLSEKTRTRRVSKRLKDFNPSRQELNSIRQQLKMLGLLLLTGSNYYDLKISDMPLKITASDSRHSSSITLKKKGSEIVYQTSGHYEQEIDQSLLYASEDISIYHFLNLISTLIDLYPNGQITINRNKIDLYQDPMKLGVLLAREKFSQIDLRDDIVDNFLYNFYVFEEYQRLMRNIPSDVIPILDELV